MVIYQDRFDALEVLPFSPMSWASTMGFWTKLLFVLLSIRCIGAVETNRTIDNKYGDSVTGQKPIFLPPGSVWQGDECLGCPFQADRSLAFNGTWNAATFIPEAEGGKPLSVAFSFTGTAIYIFLITANQIRSGTVTTRVECNFTLDSQHAGSFQHVPNNSEDVEYNVLAFKNDNLSNINHVAELTTAGARQHLFLVFDYAMYTFDDGLVPTPNSSASAHGSLPPGTATQSVFPAPTKTGGMSGNISPIGAILGGTIGGLAVVLCILLLLCIYRNKEDQQKRAGPQIEMNPPILYALTPTRGTPFNSSLFTFRKPFRSRPSIARSLSRRFEKPPLHRPTGNTATENGAPSANTQGTIPAATDVALRARRADLERRLRAVEQELRDMGVEPRRGPPGPNVSPAMLQTRVYIEYRRLQGEMEEPPPEYSEG